MMRNLPEFPHGKEREKGGNRKRKEREPGKGKRNGENRENMMKGNGKRRKGQTRAVMNTKTGKKKLKGAVLGETRI